MPKKTGRVRRGRPRGTATVLFATVYDPDNRRGNVRLIIEGPFSDNASAVAALKTLAKGGSYSVADTQVVTVSSAAFYRETIKKIRAILKKQ